MFLRNKTDWSLLAKYMAGETDAKESESVMTWAAKRPENRKLLQEIKSDWEKIDRMEARFDVDSAWNKLHGRITGSVAETTVKPVVGKQNSPVRFFSLPMRIAASLLLLVMLGTAVVTTIGKLRQVTVTSAVDEKGRVVELPDGSTVYLNENTSLSYSKKFGKNNRDLNLTGEAYFDVTPDREVPFRIYAGKACIKVVGTSFNINAEKNNGQVEVYVESGIVELSESGNTENSVLIHPGNIGMISGRSVSSVKVSNANSIAWKTGAMTFADTPLTEVIALLNKVYDADITVEGQGIDTIRINGSYNGDPLDLILKAISKHNPELIIAKSDDTGYLSQ